MTTRQVRWGLFPALTVPPGYFRGIFVQQSQNYLADILETEGWRTPETYFSRRYEKIPFASGVYLFLHRNIDDFTVHPERDRVMYVGMSECLARRLSNHPIFYELSKRLYVQPWFKTLPSARLRAEERQLIARFNAPFNIIGRPRGFDCDNGDSVGQLV